MAEQEEGWPLGLQPINARVGGINRYFSGPLSFNTSPTCSSTEDSSSDLDTRSIGSFFHDKSITLGSLIGVHDIQLSRRSPDRTKIEPSKQKTKKSNTWCFSWCASNSSVGTKTGPSLGHFLEVDRKAAASQLRRPTICGVNEFFLAQPISEPNSLFVNGLVAPPSSNPSSATGKKRRGTAQRDRLIIGGCEICLPLSSCISRRRHSFSR